MQDETRNLRRELLRAQAEVKRIQSVPLVIGQFNEAIDEHTGTGTNAALPIARPTLEKSSFFGRLLVKPKAYILFLISLAAAAALVPSRWAFAGIVSSTTGSNYYVRILSTIDHELLKPGSAVALHKHRYML